jgi:hypothetical protein
MTPETRLSVPARLSPLDPGVIAPMALSFTRFVAAHGSSDSLRATERPLQTASHNPLTFTHRSRANANGETV